MQDFISSLPAYIGRLSYLEPLFRFKACFEVASNTKLSLYSSFGSEQWQDSAPSRAPTKLFLAWLVGCLGKRTMTLYRTWTNGRRRRRRSISISLEHDLQVLSTRRMLQGAEHDAIWLRYFKRSGSVRVNKGNSTKGSRKGRPMRKHFDPQHNRRLLLSTCALIKFRREFGELAFYEKTILLEACARSQMGESHSHGNTHQATYLDLPWTRDFLDVFALIAAGPGEASNVSAAFLELSQNGDFITIRVAKNEDFDSQARQRLSQITEIMNQVRWRGVLHS